MSRQNVLRCAIQSTKNRFPLFGSSVVSQPCSHSPRPGDSQSRLVQTSSLQPCGSATSLAGSAKPFSLRTPNSPGLNSYGYGVSRVVLSAQLSTAEVTEGVEGGSSVSSVEGSDSVEDADGRSRKGRKLLNPPKEKIAGHVTPEGTDRYYRRFANVTGRNHFRKFHGGSLVGDLILPSLGLGEYRGKENDTFDRQFGKLIRDAAEKGVNFFDVSHLMRSNHCERILGHTIPLLIKSDIVSRDEIIVCTKGGMILRENYENKEYREEYLQKFVDQGLFELDDVAIPNCLNPTFLKHQLNESRRNLGLETIDIYYLQNIECQMNKLKNPDKFYDVLKDAFTFLESSCEQNLIKTYGITTRYENFIDSNADNYISVEKIAQVAKDIGGEDSRLKFLQIPLNISCMDAITQKSQCVDGEWMSTVEAANKLGFYVVAQATDFSSRTYRDLQAQKNYKPESTHFPSYPLKCLHYSRNLSGVGTVLFTTRRPTASNLILETVKYDY